ncbi:heterogeneous nuclear ribonucleoprotein Q [Mercurialis annua]|uniref:heterogeneous nuclear ribonucleoprotein Q n=1 Tax=Mercurialis annua TaxID=3986 RepID=UPI00215F7743|nr:heterogeneous nuclear ribonucleoprotein Q [Mercurialis annua]XP_050237409.1 heterogeneous nuclear ribonucleoprotein Q [Mercurialis annua]
MADGSGVEDRVDFEEEEDNYMEDDGEDQVEVEGDDDDDDNDNNSADGEVENNEEEDEDSKTDGSQRDQSPEMDRSRADSEPLEDEEKPTASLSEEDKEKHAELLALPPHGSEVFIGGLPKDASENDLRDLCEPIGDIFEIRLMKDKDTGESKGFAFVGFKSKEVAKKAIQDLHSKEFKGKTLRCSISETKNRLFIGNIPKNWTEDEFRKIVDEVGPGVDVIELIRDPQIPARNRGFAFVLYYNNACADYSRQKMLDSSFKLDGNTPTISWADPKGTPDQSAAAAQVKALYVKNIPENTSTEQLKEIFQQHGDVTKVVMPPGKAGKRDFGFIHYAERSSALKAVRDSEKYEIDGQALEVVLAKPQADKKPDAVYPYSAALPPGHVSHPGFGGFAGNPYNSMGGGFSVATPFQQPVIYGRGPMPTGMHMVPMVLPDGRIGYVLQQPGVQLPQAQPRPRRVDRSNGPSGPGRAGSSGDDGNRGRRYRPY